MTIKIAKHKKIIKEIEKVRALNNTNWMNLLRIAMDSNPKKTLFELKKINKNDKKISNLISRFK